MLDHEDWKIEHSARKHCYELENESHHDGTVMPSTQHPTH